MSDDRIAFLREQDITTPLQRFRLGHLGFDATAERWYVYAKCEHHYCWCRVTKFKTPLPPQPTTSTL